MTQAAQRSAPGGRALIQAKLTVGGKVFDSSNKEAVADEARVRELVGDHQFKAGVVDQLVAWAGASTDFGKQDTWDPFVSDAVKEVATHARQFNLAAVQIVERFPPETYAYIGLGGSPDPIMVSIERYTQGSVVCQLPLTNINEQTLSLAVENWNLSEKELCKKYETDNESSIDRDDVEEYGKSIIRPLLFTKLVKSHLDGCVSLSKLKGRRKVLVIDFVNLGDTMRAAFDLLCLYYGEQVEVVPFRIGAGQGLPQTWPLLKKEGGVEPATLVSAFSLVTYKRSHRVHDKFDVIKQQERINKYVTAAYTSKVDSLDDVDTTAEPRYESPQEIEGARSNITALLKAEALLYAGKTLTLEDVKKLPQTPYVRGMRRTLEDAHERIIGTTAKNDIPVIEDGELKWLVPKLLQ